MKNNDGFTLVELIMVFTILAILSAISLPKFNQLRNKAVQSHEDAIIAAFHQRLVIYAGEKFMDGHSKEYPASTDVASDPTIIFEDMPRQWTVQANGNDAEFIYNEGEFTYTYSCDGGATYTLTKSS